MTPSPGELGTRAHPAGRSETVIRPIKEFVTDFCFYSTGEGENKQQLNFTLETSGVNSASLKEQQKKKKYTFEKQMSL